MSDLFDRDYSEAFTIELEWQEWGRIYELARTGKRTKENEGWPVEELADDAAAWKAFQIAFHENNPGNGIDDWPESLKRAYDETVLEMMEETLGQDD